MSVKFDLEHTGHLNVPHFYYFLFSDQMKSVSVSRCGPLPDQRLLAGATGVAAKPPRIADGIGVSLCLFWIRLNSA